MAISNFSPGVYEAYSDDSSRVAAEVRLQIALAAQKNAAVGRQLANQAALNTALRQAAYQLASTYPAYKPVSVIPVTAPKLIDPVHEGLPEFVSADRVKAEAMPQDVVLEKNIQLALMHWQQKHFWKNSIDFLKNLAYTKSILVITGVMYATLRVRGIYPERRVS